MDLKDSLNLEYAGQRFTWDESGLYCIFVGSKSIIFTILFSQMNEKIYFKNFY
jgi:hypothetical protein